MVASTEKSVATAPAEAPASLRMTGTVRFILVVQALLLLLRFDPDLCTNGDNARYYLLGRALATGQGYRQIEHPDKPVESQYPPLFPALIAVTGGLAGSPLPAKVLVAVMGLLSTVLLWRILRRHAPDHATVVVALYAGSSFVADYSTFVMSEMPYLFFSLLALEAWEWCAAGPPGRRALIAACALSVLPIACRSAGVAFSVAWIACALWSGRRRLAAGHALGLLVVLAAGWALSPGGSSYLSQLVQVNSYRPDAGAAGAGSLLARVGRNVSAYAGPILGESFVPAWYELPGGVRMALTFCLVPLLIAGWVLTLRSPLRLAAVYVALYFGVLCLWQEQWSSTRFVVSVLPLLQLFLVQAVARACDAAAGAVRRRHPATGPGRIDGRWGRAGAWSVAALLLAVNVSATAAASFGKRLPADWRNFYRCADWLRANSPADAVVMSRSPALFYIRSGRRGMLYPFTGDRQAVMAEMARKGVRYVVLDSFEWSGSTFKFLFPAVRTHLERFRLACAYADPATVVLEVVPP